jgi:hypothetical protein
MDRRAATVGCGTLAGAANVRIAGPHPPMLGHTFVPTAAWPGDTGRSGRSTRNRRLCSCTWGQIADYGRAQPRPLILVAASRSPGYVRRRRIPAVAVT